jgi:hypothetical protein
LNVRDENINENSITNEERFDYSLSFTVSSRIKELLQSYHNMKEDEHIFLMKIADRLNDIFIHITERCVICDKEIENPGVKPLVCDLALCNEIYNTLDLGCDLSKEILVNTKVFDLHMNIFYATATVQPRAIDFTHFNPFPNNIVVNKKIDEKSRKLRFFVPFSFLF